MAFPRILGIVPMILGWRCSEHPADDLEGEGGFLTDEYQYL